MFICKSTIYKEKDVIKVVKDSAIKEADEPTFVQIKNTEMPAFLI
jgi:hypothetical protein